MFILDRFEEDAAFIEGPKGVFSVSRGQVGTQVEEGDVLVLQDGTYLTDEETTAARRARMSRLFGRIKR
jgi:hypothetical protein